MQPETLHKQSWMATTSGSGGAGAAVRSDSIEDAEAEVLVLAATEREVYAQGVRRTVQRDIQKLLQASKAYVKHVKGPPVSSKAALESLSTPKTGRMHQELQLCAEQGIKGHESYAEYKANKLQGQRTVDEARERHRQLKQEAVNENLAAYRAAKQQAEQQQLQRKEKEQAAMQQYRRAVACYVRQQAEAELKQHKDKVDKVHQAAAAKHARALAAFHAA